MTPFEPKDLRENHGELFDLCSLNDDDTETPYKPGQTGFLKTADSEYSYPASSSGDPLPENATVPTRDDDGYRLPGCKLEKADPENRRGRGCRRYEKPGKLPCFECLYHDCNKKVLGEANLKKRPTTASLPKPTLKVPSLPTERLPVVPQEQTVAARGSDAAKEAEKDARKEARKAEKQAERKREREAKKKQKATSQ